MEGFHRHLHGRLRLTRFLSLRLWTVQQSFAFHKGSAFSLSHSFIASSLTTPSSNLSFTVHPLLLLHISLHNRSRHRFSVFLLFCLYLLSVLAFF
jgi:hypothetical protein